MLKQDIYEVAVKSIRTVKERLLVLSRSWFAISVFSEFLMTT